MKKILFSRFIWLIGLLFSLILIGSNILSYYSVAADQFNLIHRYDQVHVLETWNLPFTVEEELDGDDIPDRVMFTGCVFLSSKNKETIPPGQTCDTSLAADDSQQGIQAFTRPSGSRHNVVVSYLGKRKNDNWHIIVIKNIQPHLYEITQQRTIEEKRPPISLRIDSLLYFLTHLFVILIGM